ncbi:hypothetical protein ACF06X_33025 [Streptomyces sp. NPDC015346]|uniref:hypothetical protein n=1 Tax=Streptomyces sp. NPDC015346 TaxID=3364954 RepID=UPI0037004844
MRRFETGRTVVGRDVHRCGRVWSEQALRVIDDTGEALVTACAPGAEARWPSLYAKAPGSRRMLGRGLAWTNRPLLRCPGAGGLVVLVAFRL